MFKRILKTCMACSLAYLGGIASVLFFGEEPYPNEADYRD